MKTKILSLAIICSLFALLFTGCKKEEEEIVPKMAKVKIKIDYLGTGGYYNDNIDGVPTGLVIGTNGPFTADPDRSYTLTYKAASNFGEATIKDWSPTGGLTWIIHCYVSNNVAHIETYLE
jgi:hypothetical protein